MAMKGYSTLKHIVRISLGALFVIYFGFILLLNTNFVQEKLSVLVSSELKEVLNTEVHIGKIDLGLLNRIIIEDVLLHDQDSNELLKVARLSAKFELAPLFKGKISISSVQLFGFNIQLSRPDNQSVPNFQFLIDALASKDTVKKDNTLDLRINSILIRRGRLSYHVASAPQTPGKFNPNHIGIKNLAATISIKSLKKDSLNATIKRLDFIEDSGFEMKKMALGLRANNQGIEVNDFMIALPNSTLKMDSISMDFKERKLVGDSLIMNKLHGGLKGNISLQDLTAFVPVFKQWNTPINLKATFKGLNKTINLSTFRMWDKEGLSVSFHGNETEKP